MEIVNLEKNIAIFKDIITESEAEILRNIAIGASEDQWDIYNHFERDDKNEWDDRILAISHVPSIMDEHKDLISSVYNRIQDAISTHLNKHDYVYVGFNSIYRARTGDFMNPHHDSGLGPHVKYGAVLYLNDGFEGGEIYYPKLDIEIKPITRSLVLHAANPIYMHGVKPVISGVRYSMTTFIELPRN